jgi:hypothetical protein
MGGRGHLRRRGLVVPAAERRWPRGPSCQALVCATRAGTRAGENSVQPLIEVKDPGASGPEDRRRPEDRRERRTGVRTEAGLHREGGWQARRATHDLAPPRGLPPLRLPPLRTVARGPRRAGGDPGRDPTLPDPPRLAGGGVVVKDDDLPIADHRRYVNRGRRHDATLKPYHCRFIDHWHLGHPHDGHA